MIFLVLLWLLPALTLVCYLAAWPSRKPWRIRMKFDVPVLLVLLLVCILVRPGIPADPSEAAEASVWRPLLSAIYVAALTILVLGVASTFRHVMFRARRNDNERI